MHSRTRGAPGWEGTSVPIGAPALPRLPILGKPLAPPRERERAGRRCPPFAANGTDHGGTPGPAGRRRPPCGVTGRELCGNTRRLPEPINACHRVTGHRGAGDPSGTPGSSGRPHGRAIFSSSLPKTEHRNMPAPSKGASRGTLAGAPGACPPGFGPTRMTEAGTSGGVRALLQAEASPSATSATPVDQRDPRIPLGSQRTPVASTRETAPPPAAGARGNQPCVGFSSVDIARGMRPKPIMRRVMLPRRRAHVPTRREKAAFASRSVDLCRSFRACLLCPRLRADSGALVGGGLCKAAPPGGMRQVS